MHDDPQPDPKSPCGWVKLYAPSGALVTLPVTAVPLDYAAMLANVAAMTQAGFLVAAPGLEAGEQREEVGYVVKREKENSDRTLTPVVDLYPADEALKFAVLSVYLNTPADVEAFEFASGLKLDKLQAYIGANKIERGKSGQTDKLVYKAPRPFGVVFKDNPKYDPDETDTAKKKPKRLFVRWADAKPAAHQADPRSRPDAQFAALRADLEESQTLDELKAAWEAVEEAWAHLAPPQRAELTEVKDLRKLALQSGARKPQPAGAK